MNEVTAHAVLLRCLVCNHEWPDVWIIDKALVVSCPNCGDIHEPVIIKDLFA